MKKKVGKALVVGAGISGIRSALDLAEVGYGVTLIDRSEHMGGILSQLDYQFPTDRCGMCKMLPLVDRDVSSQYCLRKGLFHENIDILLSTEIISVAGEAGHFQVSLRQKPAWVDPELCIGCGACVQVCPVNVPDDFNAGLADRKAIYLPVPHALPNPYVIDMGACTRCGACEEVCPTHAVCLSDQERRKFRILVVDDERIIRDSLKAWLDDEEGFSVETAESGAEALDKLTRDTYRLMLLDIKMPGMDGVEVLKKAKELLPELQVVMMTAYATVETAVTAMKDGALDYLIKPFDTETLIPKVIGIYESMENSRVRQIEVSAMVLSGGSSYFEPREGKNTWGYKQFPGVVTSLEYERIISGSGPCEGRLVRPEDGRPVRKIAWIQCVGSRDLQTDADFCSNVCCMFSIKEALLAKEKYGDQVDTTIYYMDMRTFGKSYQRYRDDAEQNHGVKFVRGRVHSVITSGFRGENGEDLAIRIADTDGSMRDEYMDMVVLAVGQRPVADTSELSEKLGLALNPWGYCQAESFSMVRTETEGVVLSGAYSGLKDISDSVIQASSAALSASRVIHVNGGSLALEPETLPERTDVSRELPKIMVVLCTCQDALSEFVCRPELAARLKMDPAVGQVETIEKICTVSGWEAFEELLPKYPHNRVLIAACLPYVYARKIRKLAFEKGLDPSLFEVVDIRSAVFPWQGNEAQTGHKQIAGSIESALLSGIARLKRANPTPVSTLKIIQRALVIGGGIAGMTAALAIADHGFDVDLVEREEHLGGNLRWLQNTLEGHSIQQVLDSVQTKIEKHPRVSVFKQTEVVGSYGEVGNFHTTIESESGEVAHIEHGVTILATGGKEAVPVSYQYGNNDAIVTQQELEIKLNDKHIDPQALDSVVMIQCVESREEPRNYCSRICCASALKHALELKEKNPDVTVYILYRDMMSYGFTETYFTKARRAGIIFIQYQPLQKPEVVLPGMSGNGGKTLRVNVRDPILNRDIQINADLVVLSSGIVPTVNPELAGSFGFSLDVDGFFQEAETKWRPVDALKEGVFGCGLAHSPRSITEAVATAEAAAQRSLRILSQEFLPAGKIVATVRHSICSLCGRCVDVCPYGARTMDDEIVQVNPLMCQGCGACAAACPNSASVLEGFHEEQMFEVIDAALEPII